MPREREGDRRGGRGSPKYPDDFSRGRGDRDVPPKKPKRTGLNDYFIRGEGINREVLQRNIAFMLGPEACSKPDKLNVGGVSGFVITAVRPFTPEQLDDLIEISSAYDQEKKSLKSADVPYERSQTSQRDYSAGMKDPREPYREERDRFNPNSPYPPPGPPESYGGPPSMFSQQSNFAYPPGSSYSPGPTITSHSYQAPGYPNSRPGRGEQPTYYEPPRAGDTYRSNNQYTAPPLRDTRMMMDPAQPRYMPQMEPMDPQPMHRGAPQGNLPNYMSQQDVRMDDYDDDFEPSRPPVRNPGGYARPARRMPEDYDPRPSANQGPYIPQNPREEDRFPGKRRGPNHR
ncbi:MAG: hypothetical protein Q9163_004609 [Psora crenata]